jgi:hypothetical protein
MVRRLAIVAAAVVMGALVAGPVHAQMMGYGGGRHSVGRPTVSPYLNLIPTDVMSQTFGTAGGYQTLVRPFVDGRRAVNANAAAISQLQSQVNYGTSRGSGGATAGQFRNYSHYYPSMSGR